jgi:hypothetical protein
MVGIGLKLFPIIRQRSNESRDRELKADKRRREMRKGETKSILGTIKQGITGETPQESAQIARAKKEAQMTARRLQEEQRQARLQAKIAAIKEAPYHAEERKAERIAKLKQSVGSGLKSVYKGVTSFGNEFTPQSPQKQRPGKTNNTGLGGGFNLFEPVDMFGSNPAQVRGGKKGKTGQKKAYNPWDNL